MNDTSLVREFRGVIKNTSFPEIFESTGRFILTRKSDAIRLLQMLAYHCPRIGMPRVTWGKRSWARLSKDRLNLENPDKDTLTVHIVLHEYAHLMAKTKKEHEKRRRFHGPGFRLCLDAIMLVWRDRICANFTA